MLSKMQFIKATETYNTLEKHVPAYYFRKSYVSPETCNAKITMAVCGFYELYLNGNRITRGFLSPYISNTNDFIYYDTYNVTLNVGENVIGVLLGNGFHNNPGGFPWDFDQAAFRSAPLLALTVTHGDTLLCSSDESFKIAPSPIRSDDYRFGEYYNANYEISGWNQTGFDDTAWNHALPAVPPKGELRFADIAPIVKECEIKPVEITRCENGYIYDFGLSNAGVCRLKIRGQKGQTITLQHADSLLENGELNIRQVWFDKESWERDKELVHKDTYICKGEGTETYQPSFTYHGFRYVKVCGVTEQQATKELLTYLVYHTELHTRGDFSCSNKIATYLQEITRRSLISNFHHFPTDCPQREKNGWTADAALTCEAALINYDPERNYREWQRNIVKAQRADGALPGIVPTAGWGFEWGNGPAWDCVLAYLPYFTYIYRGETEMITESADAFVKYLQYLRTRCDENGLLSIGLGDWCHVKIFTPKAPLILTDSLMALNIAHKMAVMFRAVRRFEDEAFALREAAAYRAAVRAHLIDVNTMLASGECQSSQAMCLYYGVFEQEEETAAFEKLLQLVHAEDDHMDVGVLGGRVIFHVLAQFGHADLAFQMITREDFPSYGNWVKRGATTLWETFNPVTTSSMNHHFWGDISAWFVKTIAGICLNPTKHNVNEVAIRPHFIDALTEAAAYHMAPSGKIASSWKRTGNGVVLELEIPSGMAATAALPQGYHFENGSVSLSVTTGSYRIIKE